MNRIEQKFQVLQNENKKAFIAYITAGDPDLETTERLVKALTDVGVDIIELGVPFSDPMADGPTIQAASQRALKSNVNLPQILELVSRIRKDSEIPLALMTYFNPVFHYGEQRFIQEAKFVGVDGIIIPDLPPEEAGETIPAARAHDLSTIFFVAPTTPADRIKTIGEATTGFIYYVSLTGVTGERQKLSDSIGKDVKAIKKAAKKPVCVGFGISTEDHVKEAARHADGVIVGSAIIKQMEQCLGHPDCVEQTAAFVERLVKALKQ